MNNLDAILEVAIGLVFSWLILSIAVMQAQEWIGSKLAWRSAFLEKAIANMLKDPALVKEFYNHPLIQSLSEPLDEKKRKKTGEDYRKPSYIPAGKFASVAFDVIMSANNPAYECGNASISIKQVRETVNTLKTKNPDLARTIENIFPNLNAKTTATELSIAATRGRIETWFDDSMDRLSGWYKRHANTWALGIGITLAFFINIDSIEIAQQLWREPTMRQAIVVQAQIADNTEIDVSSPEKLEDYYANLTIPIGWITVIAEPNMTCGWMPGKDVYPAVWADGKCRILTNLPKMNDGWGWAVKFIGLFISGLAAAQGAPFWFDTLKDLINLRGSGNVPEKTKKKPENEDGLTIPPPIVPGAVG